jgi:SAM-dependent methyltransferase
MGRTAAALTTYISSEGSYDGFDIMKQGVNWCNRKIGKDFPNFRFQHAPLGNDLYNTNKTSGEKFRFPYDDNSFDVSFLFSVFSHMLPFEVENYLCEIGRTLKPGGRCLATFFIYDHPDDFEMKHPEDRFKFPVDMGNYRLMNEKVKSANVAFQKDFLSRMIVKAQLTVEKEIEGFWKGEKTGNNDFQDIIVLKKEE